jgi:regulator of RNase E activity RraA
VAIFPDDVVMVDDDGAVVIPQNLLPDVAAAASEQERMEEWIMREVNGGASLPGLYPPNADNLARYKEWAKAR